MRSFSAPVFSLLATVLLGLHVHAMPQVIAPASGGPPAGSGGSGGGGGGGGGGGSGKPGGSDDPGTTTGGSGIPNVANATNQACVPWYAIRDAIMGGLFQGRCGDNARASIRLAFHDAGTFSLALQSEALPNGGADGSMLVDPNEVLRSENNGLQNIVSLLEPMPAQFGVSPGDVLQLAGVLGVLACPGGPVINAFIGRPAPRNIAPMGLLPNPNSPVDVLLARFADMGFSSRELMALIGAHSTGKQRFVDPTVANASFDTTVDIWDTRFYTQTQEATAEPGTYRLNSDVNFAGNASTSTDFNRFVGRGDLWLPAYAAAHLKMSLLGQDVTDLTDCSEILPESISLTPLEVVSSNTGSNKPVTDPLIDPIKLEAAIQQFRSIWLVPA